MFLNNKLNVSEKQKEELILLRQKNEAVHKELLQMMKDMGVVFNSLKLEWWLISGSALGSHLYKGFIPWDDDIDLGLKQVDRKFVLNELPKHLPKKYKLVSAEKDKYHYHFMKIINTDIKVENFGHTRDELSYLSIDICFFTKTKREKQSQFFKLLNHILWVRNSKESKIRNIIKSPVKLIPNKFLLYLINKKMKWVENGTYYMEANPLKKKNDKFFDTSKIVLSDFEGQKVPTAPKLDEYLLDEFPNMYNLPKEFKHHNIRFVNYKSSK